jgi:two-component sensor histidine kinase
MDDTYPLGSLADRIQAMALIHEMAYESANLNGLTSIHSPDPSPTTSIRPTATISEMSKWKIEGDSVELDLDKAIPCGLLMNEVLSNSFRHAFSPSTSERF